jgi:hypothetical protein
MPHAMLHRNKSPQRATACDWTIHRAVEIAAVEHEFDGYC